MNRPAAVTLAGLTAAAAITTGTVAVAQTGTAAPAPRPLVHRVLWIGSGPSASCGPNSCSGGGSSPREFTMPGTGSYVASITMSFRYRATGVKSFAAGIDFGRNVTVLPAERPLAPSTTTSTTLVFRTHLTGGHTYSLSPNDDIGATSSTYRTAMGQILVEIDATPQTGGGKKV